MLSGMRGRGEDTIQDGEWVDGEDGDGSKKQRVFSEFLLPFFFFSAVTSYSLMARSLFYFMQKSFLVPYSQ